MAQVSKDIANSIPASAGDIDVGINRVYGSSGKLGGVVVNLTNNFYNYKPRDGAAAARDLNRQLGLAYTI
jgi:hypothetical protein